MSLTVSPTGVKFSMHRQTPLPGTRTPQTPSQKAHEQLLGSSRNPSCAAVYVCQSNEGLMCRAFLMKLLFPDSWLVICFPKPYKKASLYRPHKPNDTLGYSGGQPGTHFARLGFAARFQGPSLSSFECYCSHAGLRSIPRKLRPLC